MPARTSAVRTPSPDATRAIDLGAMLLVALIALGVFRGALGHFFSGDDFDVLARSSGLLPPFPTFWRLLSSQLFWKVMWPVFGLNAAPYHLASLLVHAAGSVLLYRLLRRTMAAPAALVGAAFFAAHPTIYAAVFWASAIGDPLSAALAILALLLALERGRWRWIALPVFAAALLAKEVVVLLPLVVALARAELLDSPPSRVRRALDPVVLGMGAIALAGAAAFLAANLVDVRSGGSHEYAVRFGGHVVGNLMSYAGWTLNAWLPTVQSFSDARDPLVYGWGAAALLAWTALAFVPALRARGWWVGGAWWLACLVPVLPLEHHTYRYYLDASLAGAAWCVAALYDAAWAWIVRSPARPARGSRPAPAPTPTAGLLVAGALALGLAANGAALARKVETMPFLLPGLLADRVVDRAAIAARVADALRATPLPAGARLRFYAPLAAQWQPAADSTHESYGERNVRAALLDGLAVRLFARQVASVEFVRSFDPEPPEAWYALYQYTGETRLVRAATLDSSLRAWRAPPASR